jgi:outer membrane receptor for ferrienterochelin and colicins
MKRAHALTFSLALVFASSLARPARASDGDGDAEDLEALLASNVVSGASRSAEKADDAPATTSTVTADDLRRFGVRTLGEAVNFLAIGMVSQDPLHAIEMGSRGVMLSGDYGNHVLLVVDGHIMNEPWNGTAYYEQGLAIPIELIDHVEVIVGPGSVLYGSYAMLGVFNVTTKRAKDLPALGLTAEGSLSPAQGADGAIAGFASGLGGAGRVSAVSGVSFDGGGHRVELVLGAERYVHRGQDLTFEVQRAEGRDYGARAPGPGLWGGKATQSWATSVPSLYARVTVDDFEAFVRWARYDRSTPFPSLFGQTSGSFDQPSWKSFEHDDWLNLELKFQRRVTERLRVLARAYGDVYHYRMHTPSVDPDADLPSELGRPFGELLFVQRGNSTWGGTEVQGTFDWLGDGRQQTLFGVDGRLRRLGNSNDYYDSLYDGHLLGRVGVGAATEWLVAPYAQHRGAINDSLSVNVGLRVDAQSAFAPKLSPRAAVVWRAATEGTLKAVYSEAFRSPSFYERLFDWPGTQAPNPTLAPETVRSGEVSWEQRFGTKRGLIGVFYQRFEGLASFTVASDGVGQFVNAGRIANFGGSASFEETAGKLRYGGNVTIASARRSTETIEQRLPVAPTAYGNFRVLYTPGEAVWSNPAFALASSIVGPRLVNVAYVQAESGAGWPSGRKVPAQVELRGTVTGTLAAHLDYRLMVNYALTGQNPYAVGFNQAPAEDGSVPPALAQVNRLTVLGGVQYAF